MRLVTERLVVERITRAMGDSVLLGTPMRGERWASDYPFADELTPLRSYLDGPRVLDQESPFGLFVIRIRAGREACGGIGVFDEPDAAGAIEFGYGLVPSARGQGYATEAVVAVLSAAAQHGARVARADTAVDNPASISVLRRAGLVETRRDANLVFFERALRPS